MPVTSFSPHPVLILESDDDPMVDAVARARLRDAFHTAEVRTFSGAGHLISILRTDEMLEAVEDFLSR